MHSIKELILLLQQNKIDLLQHPVQDKSIHSAVFGLFQRISTGSSDSDIESIAGAPAMGAVERKRLSALKAQLREVLVAALEQFISGLAHAPDVQRGHEECRKLWLDIRYLSGENAGTLALNLANQMLYVAEQLDFTYLCIDIAAWLRAQVSLRNFGSTACRAAERRLQYFQTVYEAELQAESSYAALIARVIDHRANWTNIATEMDEPLGKLQPLLKKYTSAKLHLYGNLIRIMRDGAANDYAAGLIHCSAAIRFFKNRPYPAVAPLQLFHYQQLICCIQTRNLEIGRQIAKNCLNLTAGNYTNQLKVNELYALLLLHTRQYPAAARLFSETVNEPKFRSLEPGHQNFWHVIAAYLHVLYRTGRIAKPVEFLTAAGERPDVETPRDGLNPVFETAIRVADGLICLQDGAFEKFRDIAVQLKLFCEHFLSGENTRRSYCFFRMLIQISEGRFQSKSIQAGTSRYVAKLKSIPLAIANQTKELEFMPYEDLWDLALSLLPKQINRTWAEPH